MSEEEIIKSTKEILKYYQSILDIKDPIERDIESSMYMEEMPVEELRGLLGLYYKQKKEITRLKKPKYIMNVETGEVTKIDNDFISKDKIREFIIRELPDDDIMESCSIFDCNGVEIREKLEDLINGKY